MDLAQRLFYFAHYKVLTLVHRYSRVEGGRVRFWGLERRPNKQAPLFTRVIREARACS